MQMKKLLLTFSAIALMFLSSSAFALQSDNFTYEVSGSDNVTITGYTGSGGAVVIPETINTMPVVTIGDSAFYGAGITSVIISSNVTSIGRAAFLNCTGLTSVTIPGSVTNIGIDAFAITGLTSVFIPGSVTNIGFGVFASCTGLTDIDVDTDNPAYISQDGVLYNKIKSELVQYPPGKAGYFTIPDNVTMLWIGAFYGATGLTSVTIPGSVTSIGDLAFTLCTGLTSITVEASNSAYSSQDGVLYNNAKTSLLQYPAGKFGGFIIPHSVKSIEYGAFYSSIGLTSVTIPDSVTTIAGSAFYNCTGLTSVTISGNVTSIGINAFALSGLTSVSIPASVTTIENGAFVFCSQLNAAYFYGNAPAMGTDVFYGGASGFTVYYIPSSSGFTNPWYSYPTELFCPAPDLIAPSGTGIEPKPAFSWYTAGDFAWYNLLVWSEARGGIVANAWYGPTACTAGTCTGNLANALPGGKNWWWLNIYYGDTVCGFKEQPGGKWLLADVVGCGAPALTSPNGGSVGAGLKPNFTFSDSGAEWYEIMVWTSNGYLAIDQWVDKSLVCTAGSCSVTTTLGLPAGTTNWWWLNTYSTACGLKMQDGGWKTFTQN